MKNLKIRISLVLSILCLTACSESELNRGGIGEAPDGMGYFSINLTTPDGSGSGKRSTESGENGERVINNVTILLYDSNGPSSVLRHILEYTLSNGDGTQNMEGDIATGPNALPPTAQQFVTQARMVKNQDYQMIVLINTNESLKEEYYPEEGRSTLELLNKVVEGRSVQEFCSVTSEPVTTPSFFMSNANGPVPVNKSQLKATVAEAEQNPVGVKVDRMVAKVQVIKGWENTSSYEFIDFQWTLDVTNQKSYLVRQYARYSDGTMEDYTSSVQVDRRDIYATDPNFGVHPYPDFHRVDISSNETNDFRTIYRSGESAENQWIYAFENTMETIENSYLDYTTQVLIRGTVIPNGLADGNGGSKDYYSFVNDQGIPKIFTHEEVVLWVKESTFPVEMSGLKDAIGTTSEFDFTENSTPSGSFRTSGGITYHKAGMNVYRLPVKHFGGNSTSYGCYGLVRNNVYKITIKNISGPGTGGTGYIAVDIKINDWYVREQEEDI